MIRYFQHLDKSDEQLFGKVTELIYIDDTDPDMVLYYFKDGTKCNSEFIGTLNEQDAFGKYIMAEVENTRNIWKIDKIVLEHHETTATTASGEVVTIPDMTMMKTNGSFQQAGTRYNFIPPKRTDKHVGSLEKYYLSYINEYGAEHDIEKNLPDFLKPKQNSGKSKSTDKKNIPASNSIEESEVEIITTKPVQEALISTAIPVENEQLNISCENFDIIFSIDKQRKSFDEPYIFKNISLKDKNNNILWEGSLNEMKEKLIVTEPKYEVIKSDDENIKPVITNPDVYKLVSSMIQAANKEICDVDLGLALSLPPQDLYNVLKNVYGKEYTDMFVLYLAYNLPGEALRQAIAEGLKIYYSPDNNLVEN